MNQGRKEPIPVIEHISRNSFWLLGFIEGEGTFGIKNLVPYFQIGQHIRNYAVMIEIKKFLEFIPKGFSFSVKSKPMKMSEIVHGATNV